MSALTPLPHTPHLVLALLLDEVASASVVSFQRAAYRARCGPHMGRSLNPPHIELARLDELPDELPDLTVAVLSFKKFDRTDRELQLLSSASLSAELQSYSIGPLRLKLGVRSAAANLETLDQLMPLRVELTEVAVLDVAPGARAPLLRKPLQLHRVAENA